MGCILPDKPWDLSCFGNPSLSPAPVSASRLLPVVVSAKGPLIELKATLALFQPSPPVTEPASLPSAVPELEEGLLCCVWALGPEPQKAGQSTCQGIFRSALQIDTETTMAPEASCLPKNQLKEEKPALLDFHRKLVAEQLTYKDAVSSWALRMGQGWLFFCSQLPYTCLSLMWTPMTWGHIPAAPLINHRKPSGSLDLSFQLPATDC